MCADIFSHATDAPMDIIRKPRINNAPPKVGLKVFSIVSLLIFCVTAKYSHYNAQI
jgi:hypothetical protein